MAISIFLAKVFALYFILVAMVLLIRRDRLLNTFTQLIDNPGTHCLAAIITLILGILLVTSHNIWVMNWRVVITLFSWLTLIKGLLNLLWPEIAVPLLAYYRRSSVMYFTLSIVMLIIGLCLFYLAYRPI